jgi:UDP-N-acetylmuramoyl-L-alanyl-D-glutamate--2,6-diaminopimelate ligase
LVEFDRSKAIEYALHHAAANDLVLLAGKGHESTQVIGQQMLTYSDRAEVARLFGLLGQGVQHAS